MSGFRRTALGEMLHAMPPVIRWLLLVNVGIWLLELICVSFLPEVFQSFVLRWLALWDAFPWVWQLVTYAFLHDPWGIMHVAFNMLMLWMFGRDLERGWGGAAFLKFYVACGVGAGLLHVLVTTLAPQLGGPVLGASGAVLGVLIAYGMVFPDRTILAFLIIPMKARHYVLLLAAIELLLAWNPQRGVANFAHLGGMLTAWLYLRHGWRAARLFRGLSPSHLRASWASWRRGRQRSRFVVVDEEVDKKQWDEWLEKELDDETKH